MGIVNHMGQKYIIPDGNRIVPLDTIGAYKCKLPMAKNSEMIWNESSVGTMKATGSGTLIVLDSFSDWVAILVEFKIAGSMVTG